MLVHIHLHLRRVRRKHFSVHGFRDVNSQPSWVLKRARDGVFLRYTRDAIWLRTEVSVITDETFHRAPTFSRLSALVISAKRRRNVANSFVALSRNFVFIVYPALKCRAR